MTYDTNPFVQAEADRHAIWEMLVRKDIDGFVAGDWSIFADSFKYNGFAGLDAKGSLDPADWTLAFPTVESYRDRWLADARRSAATSYAESRREALYRATNMRDIRVEGATATARKTFNDAIAMADGGAERLNWQSIFFCSKDEGSWKITGFVGFLPFSG
jgi:hypothetical protein